MSEVDFWREIATGMQAQPEKRHGLVFLHGYCVTFDYAAIRAAQIGFDLKIPGMTAFYSWPSCGTYPGYSADEASIEASEKYIADFLKNFVLLSGAEHVHIIAHSMGNRGLLRALQRLAASTSDSQGVKFAQIILAAPDVDRDLFSTLASIYSQFAQRTTLYASQKDNVVACSEFIHNYPRVGLSPPITVLPGIDTVEVPKFNVFDYFGHGYYAEAEGLLHDIFDLIRRDALPDDRQRLEPKQLTPELRYWVMTQ